MDDYKLSASLEQHEDDVRDVAFPDPDFVLSASRDSTVRVWKVLSLDPPKYDCTISSHASAFINSVTYFPSCPEYPKGLIISGGKDTIIDVRQPGKSPEENADALLLGHSHNICALDVSFKGKFVVSGSWDGSARVWKVGKWECEALLEGHQGSVWAVLAYDEETIITGCADNLIRIFTPSGKQLRTIKGGADVVRALCRVLPDHPSKAEFGSAGNDGVIRLWRLNGQQVGELHGHESFIYSLASLPNGELVSSSEDRTVRIWRGSDCIQTITHPAISVWSVAACANNGDIVSGASDRKVRVFSRTKARQAQHDAIQAFEESVKSSSIPQQQVPQINKEKLPGPEWLQQKSGTKEGQVVMIKEENGSISAHQWSQNSQQWQNVGTVVDAIGSSGKKIDYLGKEYDYVFDVDIEDGKPPLKLPYSLSQNPYEAATKFIQDNKLPMTYLDQVANFITKNTQGATLGQSSETQTTGDAWGTESRYRPGDNFMPATRPSVLPQTAFLAIKTASLRTIFKKITELNTRLVNEGSKDLSFNPSQLSFLETALQPLEQTLSNSATPTTVVADCVPLALHIAAAWPPADRLPGLDLLRLLAAASPEVATYRTPTDDTIIDVLASSGVFEDPDRTNNVMLAARVFSNLFETPQGRDLADTNFQKLHSLVQPYALSKTSPSAGKNRNLTIAIATLYLNFAVLFSSPTHSSRPSSFDRCLLLLDDLTSLIPSAIDAEATYRSLVAAGTLLVLGTEVKTAARDILDLEQALSQVESKVKEPRVKGVVAEIRALLKNN